MVQFAIFFAPRKVQFAPRKYLWIIGSGQSSQRFFFGDRQEWRQQFSATFANRIADGWIAYVRKKKKRSRRAEFLSLKQQWCPWSKKKKSSHRAIASGRSLKAQAFTGPGVCDLIVIFDETKERLRGNAKRRSAAQGFSPRKRLS